MTIRFNFFLLISLGLHLFLIFFLSFQVGEDVKLKEYISSINLEFSSYQRFDRPIDSDLYQTANKQGLIKEVDSKKLQSEKKENNEANKYCFITTEFICYKSKQGGKKAPEQHLNSNC